MRNRLVVANWKMNGSLEANARWAEAFLALEEKLYDKRVNEVSGGQRQRIMLAVTALLDKPLLVVDEPTSALDPESCLRVINFFKSLCSKGMTILSVSHDKQFAAGCDKVFTL